MANKWDEDEPNCLGSMPPEEAIAACRRGDHATLAEHHVWLTYKLSREASVRWDVDVQDCYTEASLAMLGAVHNLNRSSTNPTSYIWNCIDGRLHNFCAKEVKRRKRRRQLFERSEDDRSGNVLDNIMSLCNDRLAVVVFMRLNSYNWREISREVGVPASTLQTQLKQLETRYCLLYGRVKKSKNLDTFFGKPDH